MKDDFTEKRSEPGSIINQYYSVEFSLRECGFTYQFKIRDIPSKGVCVLVKEDSNLLNYLDMGTVLELKYYTNNASKPIEYLKTRIRHITKDEAGRFKGIYLVGISIVESPNL